MKHRYLNIILMAAAVPLAALSCKKDVETSTATDAEVILSAEAGLFLDSDAVAVNSEGLASDMVGAEFSASEDGALTPKNGSEYRFKGTDGASFRAWFPVSATASDGKVSFSAEADQSTAEGLHRSDFMTACTDVHRASAQPVTLPFSHRMAKLQVVLDGFDAAAVRLRGAGLGISWETETNRIFTAEDGTAVPVSLCRTGEGSFLAMLPAQKLDVTASEENPFITVTTEGGRTFSWNPSSELRLSEGKSLVVTLSKAITGTELVAVSVEMEAEWGAERTDATASLEEIIGEERKLDGKALGFTAETSIPKNPWAGGPECLFDGNYSTTWYSDWITGISCGEVSETVLAEGMSIKYLPCSDKDHDFSDFTFESHFELAGSKAPSIMLPWSVIVDMKATYNVTKLVTVRCPDTMKEGHMSLFQRIKDYAYYVSNDKVNWKLVAEGTMPVYGDASYTVTADPAKRHAGRYLKFEIKSMHWREKMEGDTSENAYHEAKKCSSTNLGPVILSEIEIYCK